MSFVCHLTRRCRVLRIPHDSPRMFLSRLRKHVGPKLPPERDKKRPYPFSFASTMTNIFLTIVLHWTIVGFLVTLQKEETVGETILPVSWKTLREVRSVSAYLTERLDSNYMINSLLPQNYRACCPKEFNFQHFKILLNKKVFIK